MRRRVTEPDGDDDDAWDEPLDEADEPTIPCPYCKRLVYEDAQRCPYCEQYISLEDARPARKKWWIVLGALLCFYVVLRWIFM